MCSTNNNFIVTQYNSTDLYTVHTHLQIAHFISSILKKMMNVRDMADNIFYTYIKTYVSTIKKHNKITGFTFESFKVIKNKLIWKLKV